MKHIRFKSVLLLVLFAITFLFCHSAMAARFSKSAYGDLEKQVRTANKPEEIAKKMSDTKGFHSWSDEMDQDFKLYIAIMWFHQQYMVETATLLHKIKPTKKYYDLWVYYQAMILMYSGKIHEVGMYLSHLETKYPKDVDYLFLKSMYLSQTNHLLEAINIMDDIIKKHRRSGDAYLQRGYYHLLAYSNELAMKDFSKAIKYLPEHEINKRQQALFQNGLLYMKYKFDQKKGMALIKEGVALDPASELVKQVMKAIRK